jgi:Na+-driven multidrug efflux pump
MTPTCTNVIGFWLCEVPLAWMLAYPVGWGARGVFASIPIAEALISLMGLAMFVRGGWKRRAI